jgi:hypothetical protein
VVAYDVLYAGWSAAASLTAPMILLQQKILSIRYKFARGLGLHRH